MSLIVSLGLYQGVTDVIYPIYMYIYIYAVAVNYFPKNKVKGVAAADQGTTI